MANGNFVIFRDSLSVIYTRSESVAVNRTNAICPEIPPTENPEKKHWNHWTTTSKRTALPTPVNIRISMALLLLSPDWGSQVCARLSGTPPVSFAPNGHRLPALFSTDAHHLYRPLETISNLTHLPYTTNHSQTRRKNCQEKSRQKLNFSLLLHKVSKIPFFPILFFSKL